MDVLSVFGLTGRTAAVTGGASGIGEATALTLAAAGAHVVVGDLDEAGAEETARKIAKDGGSAVAHRTDVMRKADLDALIDRAVAEYGRLDVMCNIAGIPGDGLVSDISEADLDRVIGVNLKGTFFGCQAAMRVMVPQGSGAIVNVSSAAIDAPVPKYGLYALTKAAVAMLTMTLATEAGPHGIRVNAIAPGATITRFTARHLYKPDGSVDQAQYDVFVEQMKKLSPLGLVGDAADQANLILYLVSDAGRFCTGQIWRANGGQTFAW
jgi:3-oxoacyl-[acyl-carrier protein] reductase